MFGKSGCDMVVGLAGVSDADLLKVAEKACAPEESMHDEPFEHTPAVVADMLKVADAWGGSVRDRNSR